MENDRSFSKKKKNWKRHIWKVRYEMCYKKIILFILQLKSSFSFQFYIKRSFICHLAHVIWKFEKVGKIIGRFACTIHAKELHTLSGIFAILIQRKRWKWEQKMHFFKNRLKKSMDLSMDLFGFIQNGFMHLANPAVSVCLSVCFVKLLGLKIKSQPVWNMILGCGRQFGTTQWCSSLGTRECESGPWRHGL